MANQRPPWAAYWELMYGHLRALDKQTGVYPVGIGETWRQLFTKCVPKVMGPGATTACQDYHMFSGLKARIVGAFHVVQYILDANFSTDD